MNFSSAVIFFSLLTTCFCETTMRVECHVVLECDLLNSCYSLKGEGGFPFTYDTEKQDNFNNGKKLSMFLARNVETVRCVLLDKYDY